ncbi:MAG: 6-phosphogluconolactonase [Sandaracinus sp.]|nr:6-phosphogluconolactonase [Sandaracinus sp.]
MSRRTTGARETHATAPESRGDAAMVVAMLIVAADPIREAASRLRHALETHGPRLAIAGGSAARVLADEGLAPLWPSLTLTWVDERAVPEASSDSNRGEASRVAPVVDAGFRLPLVLDDELEDLERAVDRVERGLDAHFDGGLDVTMLGLGEDGHVASLFPGHAWTLGNARVMTIDDSPKPPSRRLTLTRPFLSTARTHVVFAVGAGKAEAIARLVAGDPSLPASGLEGLVIVTDAAGAGR